MPRARTAPPTDPAPVVDPRPLTEEEARDHRAELFRQLVDGEFAPGRGGAANRWNRRSKLSTRDIEALFGVAKSTVAREVLRARARLDSKGLSINETPGPNEKGLSTDQTLEPSVDGVGPADTMRPGSRVSIVCSPLGSTKKGVAIGNTFGLGSKGVVSTDTLWARRGLMLGRRQNVA